MARFTIRELLLVTVIAAVAAGWLADRVAAEKRFNDFKNATVVTPEWLQANGFIEGNDEIYRLGPIAVGEAAKRLGFPLDEMKPARNRAAIGGTDTRFIRVRNLYFVIESGIACDSSGQKIFNPLDDPQALAEISVSLIQVPSNE